MTKIMGSHSLGSDPEHTVDQGWVIFPPGASVALAVNGESVKYFAGLFGFCESMHGKHSEQRGAPRDCRYV